MTGVRRLPLFVSPTTCTAAADLASICSFTGERRLAVEAIAASINDTAKALSLGRTSVYALIREGRLETVKLGRRTLVKVDSIRRLMERA